MKLILVRPGSTDTGDGASSADNLDPSLSERGLEEAKRLAAQLAPLQPQAVYSSPLRRAIETAHVLAAPLGLDVELEPRLVAVTAHDGDGLEAQAGAAWSFVESLIERGDIEMAVCVTHDLVLRSLVARAIRLPLANLSRLRQDLASYSIIDIRNGRLQVNKLNETCHLSVS